LDRRNKDTELMQSKLEVEKLMNELVPFAKQMLAKHGEFYPFGGFIREGGQIVHVGVTDEETDMPKSSDQVFLLKEDFREKARNGECRAVGIVIDVRITPPGSSEKSDAIQISLDHQSGYSADVFYPYKKVHGSITYGAIFAQQGDGDIFERLESQP